MIKSDLKKYESIAILIARTFGKNCEVVIHNLSIPQNSVVYCLNNHVTGREVGQSFDHLIRQVLLSSDFENDCTANYFFHASNGKLIKSSTALLRDDEGKAIGALCVNFDASNFFPVAEALTEFLAMNENTAAESTPSNETEKIDHIADVVNEIITNIVGTPRNGLSKTEKLDMVQFMEAKGIFLVKGAIDIVAEKLDLSKVTIYSYLSELKKNDRETKDDNTVK